MLKQFGQDKTLFLSQFLFKQYKNSFERQRLSNDNVQEYKERKLKPLYPHKQNSALKLEKYSYNEVFTRLNAGSFCCDRWEAPDENYMSMGLGVCLYTNFVLHLAKFLIGMSVLSLVSIFVYFRVAALNQVDFKSSYKQLFFAGTVGSLTTDIIRCKYADITYSGRASFDIRCPVGQVGLLYPVYSAQSLETLKNCRMEIGKASNKQDSLRVSSYGEQVVCNGQNTACSVQISIKSGANPTRIMSYPYRCQSAQYTIGPFVLSREAVICFVVSLDLAQVMMMLIFICLEVRLEKREREYFQGEQITLTDFSVKVSGFNFREDPHEFEFFLRNLDIIEHNLYEKIVQLKVPETQTYINCRERSKVIFSKLMQIIQRDFTSSQSTPYSYSTLKQFKDGHFTKGRRISFQDFQTEIMTLLSEFESARRAMFTSSINTSDFIVIVFTNPVEMRKLYVHSKTQNERFWLQLGDKEYRIEPFANPDLINWGNLHIKHWQRVAFSWLLTVFIILLSYICFGWLKSQQTRILGLYNFSIDCKLLFLPIQMTRWDQVLNRDYPRQFLHCYCMKHLLDERCSEWYTNYGIYLAIPLVISVGLWLFNQGVASIFRALSRWEGHLILTDQLYSYTLKRSFALIMSNGLMMLLVNMRRSKNILLNFSFVRQGSYSDLTADWYEDVGVIITLTMVIGLSSPVVEVVNKKFVKWTKLALDSRWFKVITSKKTKAEYMKMYAGDIYPIQERYASLISLIFIMMAFNCGIPSLTIVGTAFMLLSWTCDKLLLFRNYKKPPNFDEQFQRRTVKTIFMSVVVHAGVSCLILTEPNLLIAAEKIQFLNLFADSNSRIGTIFRTWYVLPYVAIFTVLLVWGILQFCLAKFADKRITHYLNLAQMTRPRSILQKNKFEQYLLDSLDQFQLQRLYNITQLEKKRIDNESEVFASKLDNTRKNSSGENLLADDVFLVHYKRIIAQTQRRLAHRLQSDAETGVTSKTVKRKLVGLPGYFNIVEEEDYEQELLMLQLYGIINTINLIQDTQHEKTDLNSPIEVVEQIIVDKMDSSRTFYVEPSTLRIKPAQNKY